LSAAAQTAKVFWFFFFKKEPTFLAFPEAGRALGSGAICF
jgi:hypothetical protein